MWQMAKGSESCQESCKLGISCRWSHNGLPGWVLPTPPPAQISHLLHPSVSWLVLALSCHCPVVPCVGVGSEAAFWGYPMDLSVCLCLLSVRLSFFPGVLCHRSPPRLICPCSNWPPTVLVTPNCVSPPFCVTNHCPGAPALPPRTPACLPARPMAPGAQHWALGNGRLLRPSPPTLLPARS